MNVLVYLLPMALGLGLAGLLAFLWSLRSGQYDDLDGAALRILSNDDIDSTNGFMNGVRERRSKAGAEEPMRPTAR